MFDDDIGNEDDEKTDVGRTPGSVEGRCSPEIVELAQTVVNAEYTVSVAVSGIGYAGVP